MRSYSITVRPDSVKGKYHSFVVRGSLIYWALSILLVSLIVLGLIFYYAVMVPYEVVAARSNEARELELTNAILADDIDKNRLQLDAFDKQVQAHLTVTEKFNFLFGIDDVGGGGYGVEATGEFDEILNTMDLVEDRYQKLSGYMSLLDRLPIRFPILGKFRLTSAFGPRRSPFSRKVEMHRGIDLAAKRGVLIVAAGSGIVESAGRWSDMGDPKYARLGRFVKIRHGETGYVTLYGHCSEILVKTGDEVVAGQKIAKVGNSGWSTAPHLHFGIIQNNRYVDPKFYLLYFDAELIVNSAIKADRTGGDGGFRLMADANNVFEAMVIPKGARIIAEEGAEIELNVQGDLILQESQKGLSALISHHGSILIDKDVVVNAHNIRAKHVIRIMGTLDTEDIKSESITIDNGKLECNQVDTEELTCENAKLGTSTVKARKVHIKGGHVEVGSIHADSLKLENKVKGSILISSARERKIDDNVMIKGGFESDVELLGYLLKYRREIMSDRVLKELKSRKEGQEFKRFFVDEDEMPALEAKEKNEAKNEEPEAVIEVTSEVVEEEPDEIVLEAADEVEAVKKPEVTDTPNPEKVKETLKKMGDELEPLLPSQQTLTALMKLILASLRQGDTQTLKAIFDRWSGNLQDELETLSAEANEQIQVIKGYLVSVS